MDEKEYRALLLKYREGIASDEEEAIIHKWFYLFAETRPFNGEISEEELKAVTRSIRSKINIKPRRPYISYIRWAAAAVVLIAAFSIFYLQFVDNPFHHKDLNASDIKPGTNKAILALASGEKIILNAQSGTVATKAEKGVMITNNAHTGIVTFQFNGTREGINQLESEGRFNTLSTPAGGQYSLMLSDGTRVSLNAASTITFPSRFAGNTRSVSLIGEAYFDVSKDPKHPFIVTTNDQTVTVLGTQFNINAYSGEPVRTTLAEGSVRLSALSSSQQQLLKPNQQAVLLSNRFEVRDVVASDAIAWKDGVFKFMETPLKEAMQQIGRWYNVEIGNDMPDTPLTANISRDLNLEQVITSLGRLGFTFNYDAKERRLLFVR